MKKEIKAYIVSTLDGQYKRVVLKIDGLEKQPKHIMYGVEDKTNVKYTPIIIKFNP